MGLANGLQGAAMGRRIVPWQRSGRRDSIRRAPIEAPTKGAAVEPLHMQLDASAGRHLGPAYGENRD